MNDMKHVMHQLLGTITDKTSYIYLLVYLNILIVLMSDYKNKQWNPTYCIKYRLNQKYMLLSFFVSTFLFIIRIYHAIVKTFCEFEIAQAFPIAVLNDYCYTENGHFKK